MGHERTQDLQGRIRFGFSFNFLQVDRIYIRGVLVPWSLVLPGTSLVHPLSCTGTPLLYGLRV